MFRLTNNYLPSSHCPKNGRFNNCLRGWTRNIKRWSQEQLPLSKIAIVHEMSQRLAPIFQNISNAIVSLEKRVQILEDKIKQ